MLRMIAYILTLITGFTGLVYQVTWHKYLSFFLGSHALATSIVLSVFFLFLSLGYITLGRNAYRIPIKNKLFLYGIIEFLIGAYVLISPELFHILSNSIPVLSGSLSQDILYGFIFASLFIGFPTFLMGSTIPVLTLAMSNTFEKSHQAHATVYGLNTMGAVGGALATGFIFIESLGMPLTLLMTSFVNIGVGFITWLISKKDGVSFSGVDISPASEQTDKAKVSNQWHYLLLTISALSGFYVFSLENLIIRISALSIGSNNYTYSIIVSAFIFGIALGSLLIRNISFNKKLTFFWIQSALVTSLIILYLIIPEWPELFGRIRVLFQNLEINIPAYWTMVVSAFVIILAVPTALMGMNLPLLFNYLRAREVSASQTVGNIYSINTLGSVFGSIVGGYLLLAYTDWDTAFLINISLVIASLPLILWLSGTNKQQTMLGSAAIIIMTSVVFYLPTWNINNFIPRPTNMSLPQLTSDYGEYTESVRSQVTVEESFYGPSTHAAVVSTPTNRGLYINANPNTGTGDYTVRAMNAVYPLSLVPKPEKVFVVGLGGGLSSSLFAKTESVESVIVSEISSSVVETLPFFDKQNENFTEQDYFSKVQIHAVDAIKLLRTHQSQYDIIVSEPNHPWVAGVENLFSKEFLTEVKNNLSDHGVYAQWFPLFGSNTSIVLTMLNTIADTFENVHVFSSSPGTLTLIASKKPIQVDKKQIEQINQLLPEQLKTDLPFTKDPYFILGTQVLTDAAVRSLVKNFDSIQTLEYPRISYMAYRSKFIGQKITLKDDILPRLDLMAAQGSNSQFLYQQLAGIVANDYFTETAKALNLNPEYQTLTPQFWFINQQQRDSSWPLHDEKIINEYAYLTGASSDIPSHLPERKMAYMRLFQAYQDLVEAQVPIVSTRLLELIPQQCDSDTTCLYAKRYLIATLNRNQAYKVNLDIQQSEQIEALYKLTLQNL